MQSMKEKMDLLMLKGQMKLMNLWNNEDGDTNFISIVIVLVIVLAVAIVFIQFKDKLLPIVSKNLDKFFQAFDK